MRWGAWQRVILCCLPAKNVDGTHSFQGWASIPLLSRDAMHHSSSVTFLIHQALMCSADFKNIMPSS